MCIVPKILVFRLSILWILWSLSTGLVQEIHGSCEEKSSQPRNVQHGRFRVLYNHILMNASVNCSDTVTFTAHASLQDFNDLEPLLERWRAPISLAVYAPGWDFYRVLKTMKRLRNCGNPLVKEFVTVHLYFDRAHAPLPYLLRRNYIDQIYARCDENLLDRIHRGGSAILFYDLDYPINVGRSIARKSALTHFVLEGDLNLRPTPELPSKFLGMMSESNLAFLDKYPKKVFVLPVFEVAETISLPLNKTALIPMLKTIGMAKPSGPSIAANAQNILLYSLWQDIPETDGLNVTFSFNNFNAQKWQPVFIGLNEESIFDELITLEHNVQKHELEKPLGYEFFVLDNAFLVHHPRLYIKMTKSME